MTLATLRRVPFAGLVARSEHCRGPNSVTLGDDVTVNMRADTERPAGWHRRLRQAPRASNLCARQAWDGRAHQERATR